MSLYRAIKFSLTKHRDLGVAAAELKRAIESVLAPDYEVENPVTNARGRIKLIENATSEQKVLFAELRSIQERLDNLEASDRGRMEPALLDLTKEQIVRALAPASSFAAVHAPIGSLFGRNVGTPDVNIGPLRSDVSPPKV